MPRRKEVPLSKGRTLWLLSSWADCASGLNAVRAHVGRHRATLDDNLLPLEVRTENPVRRPMRMAVTLAGFGAFAATWYLTLEGHNADDCSKG
jgi:hypothetical protein